MQKNIFDSELFGWLKLILGFTLLWAIFNGVTIGGKHYGIRCTDSGGVEIDR